MSATKFTIVAGKAYIDKDPNAVLDYPIDFTKWLDAVGDSLASHTVTVTGGVVCDSSSIVGKAVVLWISGGTVGTRGSATVRVTTNNTPPRIDDRTVYFTIKEA
jgi:hypothetical protein